MTCVVGVKADDGIYMGADRAVSNFWGNTWVLSHPKIFHKGPCMIGFAGSLRGAQILQYNLDMPPLDGDAFEWCVSELVPEIQECFDYHGYDDEEGTSFLVSVDNNLFFLNEDYSVLDIDREYLSIGDGAQFSDGVLAALGVQDPKNSIETALKAAEKSCGSVLPPFDIIRHD